MSKFMIIFDIYMLNMLMFATHAKQNDEKWNKSHQ